MFNFKYKVRDKFAELISGTITAASKEDAVKRLHEMNYVVIAISLAHEFKPIGIFSYFNRVRLQELSTFTRQLYSLQKAGIPLLSGLEAVALQEGNRYFKAAIENIIEDIRAGLSFSEALKKHSRIFDDIYVNMVKTAETAGSMMNILGRLQELIEQEIDTQSRIKAAVRYPMLAFFVLCLGFFILVTFVIPRFAVIYGQFNVALPLVTRILININIAIKKFWYLFILGGGGAIFLFFRFINSKKGRYIWDNFKLKMPIFGKLVSMLTMSRFARVTAILMQSGVPILEILDLSANTSGNVVIKRAIQNIRENVSHGKGMSEPMRLTNLFPPVVIQMVAIGEQSGKVDELLLNMADYYDRESAYMIRSLTTYIEPVLIFVLAGMVLLMALGIFTPMWNLIRVFKPY